jgi:hypothetical protein
VSDDIIESLREIIAAKSALIDTLRGTNEDREKRIIELQRRLEELQRKFATFVLDVWDQEGTGPAIPDREVERLVDACEGLPTVFGKPLHGSICAKCQGCGRRAPLQQDGDQFVCAWGCLDRPA